MTLKDNLPKIALGAWAWGNDGTFGNIHKTEELKPIYDKAMELGLNLRIQLLYMVWENLKRYWVNF